MTENSKVLVDKAKFRTAIISVENELKKLSEAAGNKVFEMYTNGEILPENLQEMCAEYDNLQVKLENLRNEIDKLSQKTYEFPRSFNNTDADIDGISCTCGYVNKAKSKFCCSCGKALMTANDENVNVHIDTEDENDEE